MSLRLLVPALSVWLAACGDTRIEFTGPIDEGQFVLERTYADVQFDPH